VKRELCPFCHKGGIRMYVGRWYIVQTVTDDGDIDVRHLKVTSDGHLHVRRCHVDDGSVVRGVPMRPDDGA